MILTPRQIVDLWREYSTDIPAKFALGSAWHETQYNAGETDTGDQGDGSDSIGLYQLSLYEQGVAVVIGSLIDPEINTQVFATIQGTRLSTIEAAALVKGGWATDTDKWAFLGMAHNMGLGAATKTILTYGGDWNAYKARNPNLPFVAKGYGDDCISGGPDWTDDLAGDGNGNALTDPSGGPGAGTVQLFKLAGIALGIYVLYNLSRNRPALAGLGV